MRVYLDHNATSPLKESARAAMLSAFGLGGNASSIHEEGRKAHALLDEARETLGRALGAIAPMVVFTSGGSEASACRSTGMWAVVPTVPRVEPPTSNILAFFS